MPTAVLSESYNLSFCRESRSINDLSEFYQTDTSLVSAVLKISRVIPLHPLPKIYQQSTCVVVGSSGVLLQHPGLGRVIDSYDYVIRMNFAPTLKFESFVGSKTSLHLAYLSSCLSALNDNRAVNGSHILFGGEIFLLYTTRA